MELKFTKTTYLIITLVILVIIAIALTIWRLSQSNQNSNQLAVYQVIPIRDSQNFETAWAIQVYFNRPLSSSEYSTVSLKLNPVTEGEIEWSKTLSSFTLTPKEYLKTNQLYTATLGYSGKTFVWKFTTSKTASLPLEQQMKSQAISDQKFAQDEKDLRTRFPWVDSFPIRANNYFVYFDSGTNKLVGKIYPQKSSTISIENQVDVAKIEIQKKLTTLKVDPNRYPINWIITPE